MTKIEVIVSTNPIIFDAIVTNSLHHSHKYLLSDSREIHNFVQTYRRIDTLIIEDDITSTGALIRMANVIINMTFPLRLRELLYLLKQYNDSSNIFCTINDFFIYNQRLSTISFEDNVVRLTERENQLLCALLKSENFTISKDVILQEVWKYSASSETSTLDTHISKLNSKLPENILLYKDNAVRLDLPIAV